VVFSSCGDMIFDVLKRLLCFVGRAAARLIVAGAIAFLLLGYDRTSPGPAELLAVFAAATLVAVVAHELGHLLACLAVGVKVRGSGSATSATPSVFACRPSRCRSAGRTRGELSTRSRPPSDGER
jgi:hypothetical protein